MNSCIFQKIFLLFLLPLLLALFSAQIEPILRITLSLLC